MAPHRRRCVCALAIGRAIGLHEQSVSSLHEQSVSSRILSTRALSSLTVLLSMTVAYFMKLAPCSAWPKRTHTSWSSLSSRPTKVSSTTVAARSLRSRCTSVLMHTRVSASPPLMLMASLSLSLSRKDARATRCGRDEAVNAPALACSPAREMLSRIICRDRLARLNFLGVSGVVKVDAMVEMSESPHSAGSGKHPCRICTEMSE